VKATAISTLIVGVPLFFLFGWLWNPHGENHYFALHIVGMIGICPFLVVLEYLRGGVVAFIAAFAAQYMWFFGWVYVARRIWLRFDPPL
jgi:hypothetical protein